MILASILTSLASAPFFLPKDGDIQTWVVRSIDPDSTLYSGLREIDTLNVQFYGVSANHYEVRYSIPGQAVIAQRDTLVCNSDSGCSISGSHNCDTSSKVCQWESTIERTGQQASIGGWTINLTDFLLGLDYASPIRDTTLIPYYGNHHRILIYSHKTIDLTGQSDTAYQYILADSYITWAAQTSTLLLYNHGCIEANAIFLTDTTFTSSRIFANGWTTGIRNSAGSNPKLNSALSFRSFADFKRWRAASGASGSRIVTLEGQSVSRQDAGSPGFQHFFLSTPESGQQIFILGR